MTTFLPLADLQITNQCVIVCDLRLWLEANSPCWESIKGSQDEVGRRLAAIVDDCEICRIDDFGGVCKTFLCNGEEYKESPPQINGHAAVFSFTPKNKLVAEGRLMAQVARLAGYKLLILAVQKHDKFGKVWVLCGMLRHLNGRELTYYEDTNTVVDEIKESPDSRTLTAVHVQAPGFEEHISRFADRVISQDQYQKEVLK